jgi:hypothetical protein
VPDEAQQTTIDEVFARLEARLDHRWKKDGITLVPESFQGGYLAAWAEELAIALESAVDIVTANDPAQCEGDPLEKELADFQIKVEPWWNEVKKLWALLLEHRILVSQGTIPDIQRVVSWFAHGDDDHTGEVSIINNVCPICGYEEPAFYTINVPVEILDEEGDWFEFDSVDDDTIRYEDAHGIGTSYWEPDESYPTLRFLECLLRATQAGVRINALIEGSFAFDELDDDTIRYSSSTGFDGGRWGGSMIELFTALVAELHVSPEFAALFHTCSPTREVWEVEVEWGSIVPDDFTFDGEDDDVKRMDALRGFDSGLWVED